MMVIITVIATFLKLLNFPMAPMLLGFILGDILEKNLSRSLTLSDGSFAFLWERPLTLTIMIFAVLALMLPMFTMLKEKRQQAKAACATEEPQDDLDVSK